MLTMRKERIRFPRFYQMPEEEVRQEFPKVTRAKLYRLDWEAFDNRMRRNHEDALTFGGPVEAFVRESLDGIPLPSKYDKEVRVAAFAPRLAPSVLKEIRWHVRAASDAFFYLCAEYPCDVDDEIRIAPAICHTEAAFRLLVRELLYCPKYLAVSTGEYDPRKTYLAEAMLIKLWFYQLSIWGRLYSLPPYDTAEAKRERTAFRREIVLGNARFFRLKEKNPPGAADFIESVSALWGL